MWIGEFAKASGVAVATVRLYVRSGLLHPKAGVAGGARPYLEFSERELRRVAAIRAGQALGMSLLEIKSLVDERRAGGAGKAGLLRAMRGQREKLARRAAELEALIRFADDKIAWLEGGQPGPMPHFPAAGAEPR